MELKNKKLTDDEFFKERADVLTHWETGKEVDFQEAVDYQKSIAPEKREPWYSRGVRKIIAKNFYIYYRLDEVSGRVYVLNVIYAKRDQLKVLNKMNLYD